MILQTEAPYDSSFGLWYYPAVNRFVDEDGNIMHCINDVIDWWILDQFRMEKKPMVVIGRDGETLYELEFVDGFDQHEFMPNLNGNFVIKEVQDGEE